MASLIVEGTKPNVPVTIEDKIEKATEYKLKGNNKFKQGKFKSAIRIYHFVFAYTTGLPGQKSGGEADQFSSMIKPSNNAEGISDEQNVTITELHAATNLNICNCYLKLKQGRKAMEYGKKTLNIKPDYWKVHLRLAEAYILLADSDQANMYISRADELQGGTEKYIQKIKGKVLKLQKSEERKQRNLYKNMFKR